MSFMSMAPRPQTYPSLTSPENGSTCQSAACAGTTSRCAWISSASREGSVPSIRAMTLVRRGPVSYSSGSSPTSASFAATYSAASRSPGPLPSPKLVESIRMRSLVRPTTSSAAVGWALMGP